MLTPKMDLDRWTLYFRAPVAAEASYSNCYRIFNHTSAVSNYAAITSRRLEEARPC